MANEAEIQDEKRKLREITISSDFLMLVGFLMAVAGWLLPEIYWVLGGTMLFFMGVMSLPGSESPV